MRSYAILPLIAFSALVTLSLVRTPAPTSTYTAEWDAADRCDRWWPGARTSDEWWVCFVSLETARCEAEGWCSDAEAIVTLLP